MKKYLRLILLLFVTFLALTAGKIADESVAAIAKFSWWSSVFQMSSFILTTAIVCLALGALTIFRLISWHFDDVKTWVWLTIGSILTGLGVGWAIGVILLMMRYP